MKLCTRLFMKVIRPTPKKIFSWTGLFLTANLMNYRENQYIMNDESLQQDIKKISYKELISYLQSPQYYTNTIVILNQEHKDLILQRLQSRRNVKVMQLTENPDVEGNFDCACTNSKGQSRLFKLNHMHDLIKIQNFYDGVHEIEKVAETIKMINELKCRVVLTYIPDLTEQQIQKQKGFQTPVSYDFDTFKQNNQKNLELLERQFEDLRYESLDTESFYGIIRNQEEAKKLGLSEGEIGQIYVMKQTNALQANESGIVIDQKEYYIQKIEPDPNLEDFNYFYYSEQNEINSIKKILFEKVIKRNMQSFQQQDLSQVETSLPEQSPSQNLNIGKVEARIGLRSLPYVNDLINEKELLNVLLVSKQIGTKYYLVCVLNEGEKKQKLLKKLINIKKSLNTQQQEKLTIITSENADMLQKHFKILGEKNKDQIRIIKINEVKVNQQINVDNFINLNSVQEKKVITDRLEEIQQQTQCAKRFKYNGKPTYNKLKYFISQSIPELKIQNFVQPKNIQANQHLFSQHQESEYNYQKVSQITKIVTAKSIDQQVFQNKNPTLLFFYKPNCGQCYAMNETFEKAAEILQKITDEAKLLCLRNEPLKQYEKSIINQYRIQNFQKFVNLSFVKYNIQNESKNFPSPSVAPLVYLFRGEEQPIQADLIKNFISPQNTDKFINFIIKLIDNS